MPQGDAQRDAARHSSSPVDTKEFLRLLTLHDQQTFAYILLLAPNWSDAEEIAQEVRAKLWQQYETRFEPGTDFGAWARTVAYYEVLSHRQATRRQPAGFGPKLLESLAEDVPPSPDGLARRREVLNACLGKLSEARRELIRLYYSGESWAQIAERLDRSTAALRKMLYRLRLRLADCIARTMRRETE